MSQITQTRQWAASEIIANLEAHREDLQTLGVRKLGLFGSYRQETARPDSDMDFLVVFEQPSFDTYMDTKFLLEDLFRCRVDLVMEKDLKSRLRPYILDEVIYVAGL